MKLIVVESPTKAKTISRFLDKNYTVMSSYGHIRDLPKSKLGVDVEKDFEPQYVIPTKARKNLNLLKKTSEKSESIILATDEDREGEAIAWHITQALNLENSNDQNAEVKQIQNPKSKIQNVERIVFHEITKGAIDEALKNPRGIEMNLVKAQQARRILDRLVGYNLSPFLWKKVARGLSAGRVQSVAVRLIADREREREAFKPKEYWTVEAELYKNGRTNEIFKAALTQKDGATLDKFALANKTSAQQVVDDSKKAVWTVRSFEEKKQKSFAPPPFKTSTLQQESSRRLGYSAKKTMMLAQRLYEGVELHGESVALITYMRTDSLNLSREFLLNAQKFIAENFGNEYKLETPRVFKSKAKNAQEAHEAIRPVNMSMPPETLKNALEPALWKLYDLIFRKAVASQMPDALFSNTSATIDALGQKHTWGFRAQGSRLLFDGFMKMWPTGFTEVQIPELSPEEKLNIEKLEALQHFTQPPPRFNEASLIKTLEENGIGRPSTYAPIISTIQERNYVEKDENRRLFPTQIGVLVNDILVEHFPEIVEIDFTAKMENELDDIAKGQREPALTLKNFWEPFSDRLQKKLETVKKTEMPASKTNETCEKCGKPMIQKFGRFGPFLACSGFPECKNAKPLPENRTGITCPKCQKGEIIPRRSKKGRRFFGCSSYPDCDFVLWNEPINEKCPQCQSILTKTPKGIVRCSNKDCGYSRK